MDLSHIFHVRFLHDYWELSVQMVHGFWYLWELGSGLKIFVNLIDLCVNLIDFHGNQRIRAVNDSIRMRFFALMKFHFTLIMIIMHNIVKSIDGLWIPQIANNVVLQVGDLWTDWNRTFPHPRMFWSWVWFLDSVNFTDRLWSSQNLDFHNDDNSNKK